jgi:hypothetical protein
MTLVSVATEMSDRRLVVHGRRHHAQHGGNHQRMQHDPLDDVDRVRGEAPFLPARKRHQERHE